MWRFGVLFVVGSVVASSGGCYQRPAWPPCVLEVTPECWDTGSGGGSGGSETETFGPIATVTTVDPTTTGSNDGSKSSGPAELQPPKIVGMTLKPNSLQSAGVVAVEIEVEEAEGVEVSMTVDAGEPIALMPAYDGATLFKGEIVVYGESWNGWHDVVAIATRDEMTSEPWPEKFKVEAPEAGSEAWLKKSPLTPSHGNAVDVDDAGEVIELFTWNGPNGPQCYVRRRDKAGDPLWPGDGIVVAPGKCVGEDVKFAPDGTIWVLVNLYDENFIPRWQLWHLDADGVPLPQTPEVGSLGQAGSGLDINGDGDILFCGTLPFTPDEEDAWVRLVPAASVPWTKWWDYVHPVTNKKHEFSERTHDCAFVEDRIVVVGEAWGRHEKHNMVADPQNRGFAVEYSFAGTKLAEVVNPAALAWHSGHRAVAPDGRGGYVAVGYNCPAMVTPCDNTSGALRWFSLDATQTKSQAVATARSFNEVALSTSGYNVVAGQALQTDEGFLVEGWSPDASESVLHYQSVPTNLQVATGIAADPLGFIVAGGWYEEIDDAHLAGVVKLHPY